MWKYAKHISAVLLVLMLAGCGENGDNAMATSSSSEREVITETASEATTEVTAETVVTTVEETTIATTTAPPETTTVATTTAPPVTTTIATTTAPPVTTTATTVVTTTVTTTVATEPPAPVSGTTSKGYSITTADGITYVNGVLIANKTYALPSTYNPGGLTAETATAFSKMQAAASAEGLWIYARSGFRSYGDQRYIYNNYVAKDGQAAADRYSARAGHSEHQSGMAIDVNSLYQSFADTAEGIWLKNNCHLYGFIIRYPQGKESITGYMYEPWHVRYVGVELATAIAQSGLCLEEYFGITSAYNS